MNNQSPKFHLRSAFTLVEVLLAVMILGIGMIMIASVYPVGANWTRQNIEETVSGVIAKNAVNIIKSKYTASDFTSVAFPNANVYPLPGISSLGKLPLIERAYGLGLEPPYPINTANNPLALQQATYFWTALAKRSIISSLKQNNADLYILVCKKGSAEEIYTSATEQRSPNATRDQTGENFVPCVGALTVAAVSPFPSRVFTISNVNSGVTPALNKSLVGSQIIDGQSGTVLRVLSYDAGSGQFTVNGYLTASTFFTIYFVPPADGQVVSPLIYVYQTSISY